MLGDLDPEPVAAVEINPDEVLADVASQLTGQGRLPQRRDHARQGGDPRTILVGRSNADDDENSVPLSGPIASGAKRVNTLLHAAILNNDGDVAQLLSLDGQVQSVSYSPEATSGAMLACTAAFCG